MSSIDEVRTGGKPVVTLCGSCGHDVDQISARVAQLLGIAWHKTPDYLTQMRRVFAGESERQAMEQLLRLLKQTSIDHEVETLTPVDRIVVNDLMARHTRLIMMQASEGGVVCGCHAAYILRELPNAVHVRIDSPMEARATEMAQDLRMTLQQAEALLETENQLRLDMARFAHGYDPEDKANYDLIVNLQRFDHAEAAHLIALTVRETQARMAA